MFELDYRSFSKPVIRFRVDNKYYDLPAKEGFGKGDMIQKYNPFYKDKLNHDEYLERISIWWNSDNAKLGMTPREAVAFLEQNGDAKEILDNNDKTRPHFQTGRVRLKGTIREFKRI